MAAEALGKYRLLGHLASGGMGEVFLAEQEGPQGFRRRVVVKRLLRQLASDPSFVEMFLDEARVSASITHPNVAQVLDLGEVDGAYFIAMEYVRGRSLREVLKALAAAGATMPPIVGVAIVADVLRGLHAAHTLVDDEGRAQGAVHRDVSPENVLLSVDGAVKLVDFGLAKALSAATLRGTKLRGKYGYLAPEQYRRERVDARTDVFACGVVLFELLTGRRPFVAENDAGIMRAVLDDPTPSLRAAIGAPERLDAIVARALEKAPDARWPSAERMAAALEEVLADGELGPAKPTLRDFAREWVVEPSAAATTGRGTDAIAMPDRTAALPVAIGPATHDPRAPTRRRLHGAAAGGLALIVGLGLVGWGLASGKRAAVSAAPSASTIATAGVVAVDAGDLHVALDVDAAVPLEPPVASLARRSSPPPKATPRDRGAQATGALAFRVRPWAEIFVDGRSIGVSPVPPLELPTGRHQVLLRNTDLGKQRSLTTNVARGETTTVRIDLLE